MTRNRWTPIATVALFALIAQPVAVLSAPSPSVGAASDDQPSADCNQPVPADTAASVPSARALTTEANEQLRDACLADTAQSVVEDTVDEAQATVDDLAE